MARHSWLLFSDLPSNPGLITQGQLCKITGGRTPEYQHTVGTVQSAMLQINQESAGSQRDFQKLSLSISVVMHHPPSIPESLAPHMSPESEYPITKTLISDCFRRDSIRL